MSARHASPGMAGVSLLSPITIGCACLSEQLILACHCTAFPRRSARCDGLTISRAPPSLAPPNRRAAPSGSRWLNSHLHALRCAFVLVNGSASPRLPASDRDSVVTHLGQAANFHRVFAELCGPALAAGSSAVAHCPPEHEPPRSRPVTTFYLDLAAGRIRVTTSVERPVRGGMDEVCRRSGRQGAPLRARQSGRER